MYLSEELKVKEKENNEMKKFKQIIALVLAGVLVLGCLGGCGTNGGSKKGKGTTDIEIGYQNTGFGTAWLDAMIDAFNEKYPEYNAYYTASAASASVKAAFGMEDVDTTDLYLCAKEYDTTHLEPLNEVLETTIEGESKTIKDKFNASYLQTEEYDGKYYTLTFGGGIVGYVYNKKMFNDMGVETLPRTTNELAVVFATLADAGIVPSAHFQGAAYYSFMTNVWFAQYEGLDYYYDLLQNPSLEKLNLKDGRYEVLKVCEKLITPEYILRGSNSTAHVSMQTKFLEGECATMISGSWLSSEMDNTEKINDFAMMKTPVISSITNKLTTIKEEAQLRKLITAIDQVADGTQSEDAYKDGESYVVDGITVSAADWDYVKNARNMVPTTHSGSSCNIPKYSNAKEGAKEFLKFMYSDEGYQIYMDALHLKMPLDLSEGTVDTSKWNVFEQNQAVLFDTAEYAVTDYLMNKHKLYIDGGAHPFAGGSYTFEPLMCSTNEADRVTADAAWSEIQTIINDRYEKVWMKNIE